jgi:Domain of unknown function (DUF1707)
MATSPTDRLRATLFGFGSPDPNMRVSDAERTEVADRLARHYSDGRLDQAEFDERVSRAMAAKTFGDFQGLFDDLPNLAGDTPSDTPADTPAGSPFGTPSAPGTPSPATCYRLRRHRRGPLRAVLTAVLVIVAANIAWHAVTGWIFPGLWLVFLVAIILIVSRNGRRHTN